MSGFFGRYDYQMDGKGRVSLPSAFRRAAGSDRFILLQWQPPALTLLPEVTWEGVQSRLLEYRRSQPEARNEVMAIASQAVEVKPDKQGRILVPAWLQQAASLDGAVRLVGNIDRIEIWNPAAFETAMGERTEDFRRFASQIFG